MSLNRHELFHKLLDQLQLHSQATSRWFKGGSIEKLIIHVKSKRWQFLIQLPFLLPYAEFANFDHHFRQFFKAVVPANFQIEVAHPEVTQSLIQSYWKWALQHSGLSISTLQQLNHYSTPKLEHHRVNLLTKSDVVGDFLKNNALAPIRNTYRRVGFPNLNLHVVVDHHVSSTQLKAIRSKQSQADSQLVSRAMKAIQGSSSQPLRSTSTAGESSFDKSADVESPVTSDPDAVVKIAKVQHATSLVTIEGKVFANVSRRLKSGHVFLLLKLTDYTSSLEIKKFAKNDADDVRFKAIHTGSWLKVRGPVRMDHYSHELVMTAKQIKPIHHSLRRDLAPRGHKRVELHLHTNMSKMDAVTPVEDYVKRAKEWGLPAIAVTDHNSVQAFPAAYRAGLANHLKIIYGVEINVAADRQPIVLNSHHHQLPGSTYVAYDVKTTGPSAVNDRIIKLSAVKISNHQADDSTFSAFINPGFSLSPNVTRATSVTNSDVKDAKSTAGVLKAFRKFCGDSILLGYHVALSSNFLKQSYRRCKVPPVTNSVIDVLPLAGALHPEIKNYQLSSLARQFKLTSDSKAAMVAHLGYVLVQEAVNDRQLKDLDQLNRLPEKNAFRFTRPFPVTLLAKNQSGLRNLFKLVSLSNGKYFYRKPRIPFRVLEKYRSGILVGSACHFGRVFTTMLRAGQSKALTVAKHYDYLEIQPLANYQSLLDRHLVHSVKDLQTLVAEIVKLGTRLKIPVVATGDVHYLDVHDRVYRQILVHSSGRAKLLGQIKLPRVPLWTTNEMLADFNFLGKDTAQKVVVENSRKIAHLISKLHPVNDHFCPPRLAGSGRQVKHLAYQIAHRDYGQPLPKLVHERLSQELKSIIDHNFSTVYLIGYQLARQKGRSRSIGSSLVANLLGITEVNPLPPHYRCPKCQYTHFFTHYEYGSGFDLPLIRCPKCGAKLVRDGQAIPFAATRLFNGQAPDVDLCFVGSSSDDISRRLATRFGKSNVYRASSVVPVTDRAAYGYVKTYENDTDQHFRVTELDRLIQGVAGAKRRTVPTSKFVIIPKKLDVYDFTPVQNSKLGTMTYFDSRSLCGNLLTVKVASRTDSALNSALHQMSEVTTKTIPTSDPGVISLFSGPKALGVTAKAIGSKTGTLGLPNFSDRLARNVLNETHPSNFSELLKVQGLLQGRGTWFNNARNLLKSGQLELRDLITCQADVVSDLIRWGLKPQDASQVASDVSCGRGLSASDLKLLKTTKAVPDWYVTACSKVKSLIPRAVAVSSVISVLHSAYFKAYFPLIYYAAYFSQASHIDLISMCRGQSDLLSKLKALQNEHLKTTKDRNLLETLAVANEAISRGITFKMVNLKTSALSRWRITGHSLVAPFRVLPGLKPRKAKYLAAARDHHSFTSKEDFIKRGRVSTTVIKFMTDHGILTGLPSQNQLSLFDSL